MTTFNVALDTARSRNARQRLEIRFQAGADVQKRLLEQVAAMVIRDKMIPPKKMHFSIIKTPFLHLGSVDLHESIQRSQAGLVERTVGFHPSHADTIAAPDTNVGIFGSIGAPV